MATDIEAQGKPTSDNTAIVDGPHGQEAMNYATVLGWHVFPVYGVRAGSCLCGQEKCSSPGKHPISTRGVHDATDDIDTIRAWWQRNPDANIGLACGPSGIFVVDIDPKNGGDAAWNKFTGGVLAPEYDTVRSRTGSKGMHLFFEAPEISKNTASRIGPGIDTRGVGGYVVIPPSRHASGLSYEWIVHPITSRILPAPKEVLAAMRKTSNQPGEDTREFIEGSRNSSLMELAGSMRRRGSSPETIRAALMVENRERCKPPLDDAEVNRVWRSSLNYAPKVPANGSNGSNPYEAHGGNAILPDGYPATDAGNAHRLCVRHGDKLRWVYEWGHLVWDSKRWSRDCMGQMHRLAEDTVHGMLDFIPKIQDIEEVKKMVAWVGRSGSLPRIEAMIKLTTLDSAAVARPEHFDFEHDLLNTNNGVVDLRTGALLTHDPSRFCTKLAPVDFDPSAECPKWLEFIDDLMCGDKELVSYLQRAIGYSLTGSRQEQVVFICWGKGSNGKSTMLDTVGSVLGDYYIQSNVGAFLENRNDGATPDIADLAGRRFIGALEVGHGREMAENVVKWFTGDKKIRARYLHQNPFEFEPVGKIWMGTNNRPIIKGVDEGIWRRFHLIPFTAWFSTRADKIRDGAKLADPDLAAKLAQESAGILAWMIRGSIEWYRVGLNPPKMVLELVDEYRQEMDPLGGFLEANCSRGEEYSVSSDALYGAYCAYSEENGDKPMAKSWFGRNLSDLGFAKQRGSRKRGWVGLQLNDEGNARYEEDYGAGRKEAKLDG